MARPAKPNVGVIGLGIIGTRAAANLRKAGNQVWVWNRSPRPEPNFLSSPAEVAESAKTIAIFVSDGRALIDVVTAMAPALGPEHIVINHATVAPRESVEAGRVVEGRHARYLEAPFTGSRDAAAAAELVFYIGGPSDLLEKARPLLEANSKAIVPVGEVGQAAALKSAMNLVVAISVSSFAEAMALLEKNGVPLTKLGEVFPSHITNSPLVNFKVPSMIRDDFEARFSLKHMFKDVQLALALAADHGIDLPASAAYAGSAMAGLQNGWGDLDFSVIARHYGFPSVDASIPAGLFGDAEGSGPAAASVGKEKKKKFSLFGSK